MAAIYSFCFWNRDIFVHYYEDGTLSHDEIGFLKKTFPGIKVFRRADQNIEVKKYLLSKGFNYCAQLRDHFLFAIRSFDMIIEKKTSFLLQIDSDVLFFSKPNEILEMVFDGNLNGCYNQDVANAYSFDNATIYKYISMPVINNFNAGLFLHNFNESFFNSAEDILAQEPDAFTSWHLEQTLFAMYATVRGKFLGLPKQYDVCRRERNLGNKVVSEHYTHNTGYDFHKDFIYKLYPKYNK